MEKGHCLKCPNYAKKLKLFNIKLPVLHAKLLHAKLPVNAEKNDTLSAKI